MMTMTDIIQFFQHQLLQWFDEHGRHDLPWQVADDPYKVWVSEIMLQQTQVKTVLNYYPKFIERFPTVADLAQAEWEDVAPYWAGLGYYARARNLHKASKVVDQQGYFPQTVDEWQQLSGIGRSTAGALMSLGLRQYGVILDGNVKRVLARFFAIEDDLTKPIHDKKMWQLAEQLCPQYRNADYTQAIMDLGATICTPKKALCVYCPLSEQCQAFAQGLVDELPFKKAKKAVPIRRANVVIFKYAEQWLWQQRPLNGLWGGLWSLPILSDDELFDIASILNQKADEKTMIVHHFTHFTWQLNIKMFYVEQMEQITSLYQGEWLKIAQIQQKAMPTAMQKVISAVQ